MAAARRFVFLFFTTAAFFLSSCPEKQAGYANDPSKKSAAEKVEAMVEGLSASLHTGWMVAGRHFLEDLLNEKYVEARRRLSPEVQKTVTEKNFVNACGFDRQSWGVGAGKVTARVVGFNSPSSLPGSKVQMASIHISLEMKTAKSKSGTIPIGQGNLMLIKRDEETPWEVADYFGLLGHRELVLSNLEYLRGKRPAQPKTSTDPTGK